jgi:hypothetical protein
MIHNIDYRLQEFVAEERELPALDSNHSLKREKRPFIRAIAGSSADHGIRMQGIRKDRPGNPIPRSPLRYYAKQTQSCPP